MNARRFPRTLAEAFRGPEYACAIERPAPRRWNVMRWALGLWAVVVVIAFLFAFTWSY